MKPLSPRRLLAVLALLSSVVAAPAATVTVDATHTVRTVDERVFGVNTAVWDGQFKNAPTVPLLNAINNRALRFPGGSLSDVYNWQTRAGQDAAWQPGFDDFAAVALATTAQVFLTINYGSGTTQLAADWVRYSNVTKGFGFKYWEIGNENYGSWEYDTHPAGFQWDPVTYANAVKDYIAAMKAVDPTIKVGVVLNYDANVPEDSLDLKSPVHTVTNPRTGATHHGWTPVVLTTLKSLGVTPDFAIYHRYDGSPGQESDAVLLQKAKTWPNDAAALRQQLNDYLGAVEGPKVELTVTENNSVYGNPGKQTTSLVNGLYLADSTGNLLQTEFNSLLWWDLRNGQDTANNLSASLYGWRNYGDYGILSGSNDPYPTYYIMKLLSHFARGGDRVVGATSNDPLLASFAAKRADGTLALLVINKSPSATAAVSFTVSGFAAAGGGSTYSYGIPQDEAARTSTGSPDLALTSLSGLGSSFQASFGPYSASVLILNPPAPATPTELHGYASGATEATLSWQQAGGIFGIAGNKVERANDSAFSQGLTVFNVGASTSYIDASVAANTTYYYRVSAVNAGGTSGPAVATTLTTLASAGSGTSKLVNIATRAYCSPGNNVTIGGFVISGSVAKRVLVRAVGPSLTAQGIGASEVLLDPTIEVHDAIHGNAIVATNDDVGDNANAAEIAPVGVSIGARALLGTDTKSAALLMPLNPGVYSFIVKGKGDTSGIVLLEVYDADTGGGGSAFVNIATRADGTTGNGVTIGGFVISGPALKHVLVRAVGPTLTTQGVGASEVLQDPTIELHDANHGNAVIATNDNWGDNGNAGAILSTGARIGATPFASTDSASAALLLMLPPGVYSFVVRGKSDTTGIALVEVYDAD